MSQFQPDYAELGYDTFLRTKGDELQQLNPFFSKSPMLGVDNISATLGAQDLAFESEKINRVESSKIMNIEDAETTSGSMVLGSGNGNYFRLAVQPIAILAGRKVHGLPRVKLYIDNNNDDDYLFPDGGSLTAGQLVFSYRWHPAVEETTPSAGGLVWYVFIINTDAAPHTYYIHWSPRSLSLGSAGV